MTPSEQWLTDCRTAGVDPLVIEHTARNFLTYVDYHSKQGTRSLPLLDWFRYYALENAAELSAETIKVEGPDSLIGRMVSVMMGSGETTFYVLAVYFGSVGIARTRQAVPAGIVADGIGILMSVWIVTWIFG